ncbi:hypothetical protein EWB00_000593 [Schistosoma japonicum]|uniref:Uncharacterized protein n=1 Tax=Schistosoma japonicum TaxID=6182 RepID=A0A4Z2DJ54_SCHJA|nr:hypothetical protein EWB00_000593 [Schistosoma japonicum]
MQFFTNRNQRERVVVVQVHVLNVLDAVDVVDVEMVVVLEAAAITVHGTINHHPSACNHSNSQLNV